MTKRETNRIIVVQPVVPVYREKFFEGAAKAFEGRLFVYASDVNMGVLTDNVQRQNWLHQLGPIKELVPGCQWQTRSLSIPINRGDIIIVSGGPRCISNLVLLLRARMLKARTIWWGQLWSSSSRRYRFRMRLALMRLADAVLLYNDSETARYRIYYGRYDRRPIGALNNGIDVEPIQKLRQPYVAKSRKNSILFIGRITDKAELGILLQSMSLPPLSTATLHIIGDGPKASALQKEAMSNGSGDRIFWHGATVDEEVIAALANQAAIFCYPGSVGLSLIHAMAYGLPAVVHDDRSTHMPEIVAFEDGITGISFTKGCSHDLAQKLYQLMENLKSRENMSSSSIIRADNSYNTNTMVDRFVEFIKKI